MIQLYVIFKKIEMHNKKSTQILLMKHNNQNALLVVSIYVFISYVVFCLCIDFAPWKAFHYVYL